MSDPLKAPPFPWFGGKRRVAAEVWAALGDVDNYVEPFAGSLAVTLGRPPHNLNDGQRRAETVNDADGYIANFWRAITHDPDAVADWCDYPVNETDLFARHLWLVNDGRSRLLNGLESDPEWFDPQIAGWWVWGINAWIGSGWCAGDGPWIADGEGIGKRPHLADAGRGVNRELPHLGGVHHYFAALAARLRDVRVCCGDWARVVTNGALSYGAHVGVFLDPPYLGDVRMADLYTVDDHTIAHDVRDWCLTNGDNPRFRIVLAGYNAEHDHLMPPTWRRHRWSASAAYQTALAAKRDVKVGNLANRHGETLWLSPHCVNATPSLFDMEAS